MDQARRPKILGESLGQGGMARVHRAHDEILDRAGAIKIVERQTDNAAFEQAYIAETRAAAALAHPNIAQVFDSGVHDGHGFIVMDLVPGRTLRAILDERRILSSGEAIDGRVWIVGDRLVTIAPDARIVGAPAIGSVAQVRGTRNGHGSPIGESVEITSWPPTTTPPSATSAPHRQQVHLRRPRRHRRP